MGAAAGAMAASAGALTAHIAVAGASAAAGAGALGAAAGAMAACAESTCVTGSWRTVFGVDVTEEDHSAGSHPCDEGCATVLMAARAAAGAEPLVHTQGLPALHFH